MSEIGPEIISIAPLFQECCFKIRMELDLVQHLIGNVLLCMI